MTKHYCLFFTLGLGLIQAADSSSWYGTWKFDPSKSHYENAPKAKAATVVISKQGDNDVLDFSIVEADGKPSKMRVIQPHKGGKVTVEPAATNQFDEAVLAVSDDHHFQYMYKKNGETVAERDVTLSPDGKTIEAKLRAKLPDGKTVVMDDVSVRQ